MDPSEKQDTGQSAVKVRMYGSAGGYGSLLTFFREGQRFLSVLVDCGLFRSLPDEAQRLKLIAHTIADQTGGSLDVVILSGGTGDNIHFAKESFAGIQITEIWLPWKEDPSNPKAVKLEKDTSFFLKALEGVKVVKNKRWWLPSPDEVEAEVPREIRMAVNRGNASTDQAAIYSLGKNIIYLTASDVLERGGVRFYILSPPGPPSQSTFLKMIDSSDVYDMLLSGLNFRRDQLSKEEQESIWRNRPFDRAESILLSEVPLSPYGAFFRKYFGYKDCSDHAPAWRRVRGGWLGEGVYNLIGFLHKKVLPFSRSALAIELVESGKVLLFPGDAEQDDWQLWHQLSWQVNGGEKQVTFQDLLPRTVLCNVGYHYDFQYVRRLGIPFEELALMTSPQLVAMLPEDQERANEEQ